MGVTIGRILLSLVHETGIYWLAQTLDIDAEERWPRTFGAARIGMGGWVSKETQTDPMSVEALVLQPPSKRTSSEPVRTANPLPPPPSSPSPLPSPKKKSTKTDEYPPMSLSKARQLIAKVFEHKIIADAVDDQSGG